MNNNEPVSAARQDREEQQKEYWKSFKNRLETVEKTYGVSKSDIAQGLGVSRQSLYNFVNKPHKGIRIDRSSIVELFDSLRFETLEGLKPGEVFSSSRRKLSIEDLNAWLLEAGYAPEQVGKTGGAVSTLANDDPQIERVSLRLRSGWIQDEPTKNYLVNNILDQVIDQSRLNEDYYSGRLKYLEASDDRAKAETTSELSRKEKEEHGYDVLSFSESVLYKDNIPDRKAIERKYRSALKRLSRAGKNTYVRAELYELYQSVLEHHYLGRSAPITLGTKDCRFRSLTIHLFERSPYKKRIQGKDLTLDRIMRSSSEIAEREIRGLSTELGLAPDAERYSYINDNPLLEAVIRCQLRIHNGDGMTTQGESFTVRYSSNATHVANLLLALKSGLCYPLNISSFFMRATGRTEKSLARVAMTLAQARPEGVAAQDEVKEEEAAGLWLASDTLTGIQKATVDAFIQWLTRRPFPQEKEYIRKYLEICVEIGDIRYGFSQARRALYEYTPAIKTNPNKTLRKFIEKIIEKIERIQKDSEYNEVLENNYFTIHKARLDNLLKSAKILLNRTSLLESEVREKDSVIVRESELRTIIDSSYRSNEPYARIIRLYAIASEMNHKFIVGNREFIVDKQWEHDPRYSIVEAIKDARDYVYSQDGIIDLNAYLSMSDVYGTVGLLSFYFGDTKVQLDQALINLIKGAHFALKTRFRRRAAQWLSFASRVCIRLGEVNRADCLLKLVTGITDDAVLEEIDVELELSDKDKSGSEEISDKPEELNQTLADAKDWDDVSWLLAQGELFLKRNKAHEAFASFFTALRIATVLKYFRIIPDCLFNMHRAANVLLQQSETVDIANLRKGHDNIFTSIKDTSSLLLWTLPVKETPQKDAESNPREGLHAFVFEYTEKLENLDDASDETFKESFDDTYEYVLDASKVISIQFWNSWRANDAIEHPVVQAIETERFLTDVRA